MGYYLIEDALIEDPNGLLHMRARYYNPLTCRFLNADPIGFAGGLNWYQYANNSPLMYVDASGLNVYAIDGTWTDARRSPVPYSNVHDLAERARRSMDEFTRYYEGPGAQSTGLRRLWQGATGAGSDRIADDVYQDIRRDLASGTGNGVVNLVGWSRGASIATQVAQRLGNDDIEVNFLGLYDAVDRNPFRDYPDTVPSNVRNFAHARSGQSNRIFRSKSYGHVNERDFSYSHSDIGTNPLGGHHNWMLNQAHRAGVKLK